MKDEKDEKDEKSELGGNLEDNIIKRLTALKTVKAFVDALKKTNNLKEAEKFTQITWQKVTNNPIVVLQTLQNNIIKGEVGIRKIKEISSVCHIYELTTAAGKFRIKVIKESEPYKTDEKGTWGVNPLSFRNVK